MQRYSVPEMSCGHCTAAIERELKAVDPNAVASFDLANRELSINTASDVASIADAIRAAGYDSQRLAA